MIEIKFLETIRGIFTAEPTMLTPAMKMPLNKIIDFLQNLPGSTDNWCTKNHCKSYVGPKIGVNAVDYVTPSCVSSVGTNRYSAIVEELIELGDVSRHNINLSI